MKRYLNRIFGFTFSRSMQVGVVLFAVLWMFLNCVQAPATGTAVPVDVDSSFVPIAPLNLPRTNHTATLLGNGKILITGGDSEGFILDSAELFDPATGTFRLLPNVMNYHRFLHTATLLPNGKVLIVGGGTGSDILNRAELFDPATETFTLLPNNLRVPRASHTATLLSNGKVLIAGGDTTGGLNGETNTAELFDPASGNFTSVFPMASTREDHTATLLPDGKVLITGGFTHTPLAPHVTFVVSITAELFDPVSATFSPLPDMNVPRARHTATLLPNGKVLIAGGLEASVSTNTAELFDPVSGTFTPLPAMSAARSFHSATLLPSGKVLIAGGFPVTGELLPTNTAELFDPTINAFTPLANPMATARGTHTATLLRSGQVLIASGFDGFNYTAMAELFDKPGSGSFASTPPMSAARFDHTATLLPSGKVLIAGGAGQHLDDQADLFDPESGKFLLLPNTMTTGRFGHTATLLANGQVLITGGDGGNALPAKASAEVFDPASETFTSVPPMASGREFHNVTLLPNGKVLITGGFGLLNDSSSITNTAELFDPGAGTFTTLPPMTSARVFHTTTLLRNGQVLITGGLSTNNMAVNTAELFDPTAGTFTPIPNAMSMTRLGHTATLLQSGQVLIAGGIDSNRILTNTAELFDPVTGTFTSLSPKTMTAPRFIHTATLLASGKVLIAGGTAADALGDVGATDTAELFDPASATFTSLSQNSLPVTMASPRTRATATLLASGQVLITGGLTTNNAALNTAELFDPGLGFSDARRPVISTVSSLLAQPAPLILTGSGFRGDSEGAGGWTNSSATNYPLLQVVRIDNDQTIFPFSDPATNWSDTTFTSETLGVGTPLPTGYYRVTIFTNAIPSIQKIIKIGTVSAVQLASAVSRKTHGSAGTFDVDLPLTGTPGIECRSGGANGDYTLVFTFANTLMNVGGASITSGTGSVTTNNIDSSDAHNYILNLTGVTNAQVLKVGLTNVSDSAGDFSSAISAQMGVLIGDINANGLVNSTDTSLVQAQSGKDVNNSNFRMDVNANGLINSTDTSIVQSKSGTGLP